MEWWRPVLRFPVSEMFRSGNLCRERLIGRVRCPDYGVGDTPESRELPFEVAAANPVMSSRTIAS